MKYKILYKGKVVDGFNDYDTLRNNCESYLKLGKIFVVSIGVKKNYYSVSLKKRQAKNYNKDNIVLNPVLKREVK